MTTKTIEPIIHEIGEKMIFKTIFGSHLYGTDSETSDKDYKGIYIETIDNIILKKDREVFHENTRKDKSPGARNTSEDTDFEVKELRRFLKDCMQGQTYALDMLFAPDPFWLFTSRTWATIIANREKLLSKNVEPYIGYCRQQAGKYGLKGSRLGELLRVIDYLKNFDPKLPLIEAIPTFRESEFARIITTESQRPHGEAPIIEHFLEVLGKKFQFNRHIKDVLTSLDAMNEKYGSRARLAQQNEGVDWKAVSHAFRCCFQLQELALIGEITFPLRQADFLKQIKKGEIDYKIIQEGLPKLMETVVKQVENSKLLPDEPDYAFWEQFILKTYKNV